MNNGLSEYLMVLDFGTGAGRCILVSIDGKTSFENYQEWSYEYPEEAQPGGSEFNPVKFWGIFSTLIQKTIQKAGIKPNQIVGISSTSQREGVVFLDKKGEEIYAGPNLDMRAPGNLEEFQNKFAEKIHRKTGHWPFPMFLPYRLLWFIEHKPDLYKRIKTILLLNNWILYKLCGEKVTDPSNGVETVLIDLFTRDWDSELIREIGFDELLFPAVCESGTMIGKVTATASAQCGLSEGTPVIVGGADTQCAMLGTSAINPGDIGVVLGTFGPIQMILSKPIIAAPELSWSGCHVVPNTWVIESTTMETGQSFRWIRDLFYGDEKLETYQRMNIEARASNPGANGIRAYIGPRLPDYRKLEFNINGGFITQLPPTPGSAGRGDFARAVLESVAFGIRLNVERLKNISGTDVAEFYVSGGLSKSDLLMEIIANTINTEVKVPKNKEGSSIGAAICAGIGIGAFDCVKSGVSQMITWENSFFPLQNDVNLYNDLFEMWKKDYKKMYGERTLLE